MTTKKFYLCSRDSEIYDVAFCISLCNAKNLPTRLLFSPVMRTPGKQRSIISVSVVEADLAGGKYTNKPQAGNVANRAFCTGLSLAFGHQDDDV
jgi:hypothetical protein